MYFIMRRVILRVMLRLRSWTITGYTLKLGYGLVLGIVWLWVTAPRYHINRKTLTYLCWFLSLTALILGRLGYILINLEYFIQNPTDILKLHRIGGINGATALAGGLGGLGFWVLVLQQHNLFTDPMLLKIPSYSRIFLHLLAFVTPAVLMIAVGAWLACIEVGCAWGLRVNPFIFPQGLSFIDCPDLFHTLYPRYPLQLMGGLLAGTMAVLAAVRPRHHSWSILLLMLYCIGASFLTLLRGDIVPTIGVLRVDTIMNVGIAVALGSLLLWHNIIRKETA